ncbi:methyl-accepting chemotaxis protein [Trinickia dinghuensis]|nr:PAS domain-containing methyl-accepting chemotaxis protein [Trinickia dinghuensis]
MKNVPCEASDQLDPDEYLVTRNDAQGIITYVNGRWYPATGYAPSDLIGAATKMLYHADMPSQVGSDVWATLARGRTWSGLQKLRRKDGSAFWALAIVTPDLRNGTVAGYISVRTRADPAQVAVAETAFAQWKSGKRIRYRMRNGEIVRRRRILRSALDMMPALNSARADAIDTIRLMSGGDLSRRISNDRERSNRKPLIESLDVMRKGFVRAVRDMRASTLATRSAASEIASATVNLSHRATQQSASLEQAAVAIEQLDRSVQSIIDGTTQAHGKTQSAAALAAQGVSAAQQAGRTMSATAERATRIAGISSMIESIAFQTSILALNASVEAARAGIEGRGFAVVAAEVRALSQRSSTAARDIRGLVDDTVAQIEAGAGQVLTNEKTIEQLAEAIIGLEKVVASIAGATHQQGIAISEVSRNISDLSGAVAHTAAMVGQAATAAEALLDQSNALDVSMAAFRLSETDR